MICVKNTMSFGSFASRRISSKRSSRMASSSCSLRTCPDRRAAWARSLLRHRIEVVVGQRDELEPEAAQFDHFLDDRVDAALARLLAVGPPHRAERAVLRAAAHGLHRRPHVLAPAGSGPTARWTIWPPGTRPAS